MTTLDQAMKDADRRNRLAVPTLKMQSSYTSIAVTVIAALALLAGGLIGGGLAHHRLEVASSEDRYQRAMGALYDRIKQSGYDQCHIEIFGEHLAREADG